MVKSFVRVIHQPASLWSWRKVGCGYYFQNWSHPFDRTEWMITSTLFHILFPGATMKISHLISNDAIFFSWSHNENFAPRWRGYLLVARTISQTGKVCPKWMDLSYSMCVMQRLPRTHTRTLTHTPPIFTTTIQARWRKTLRVLYSTS